VHVATSRFKIERWPGAGTFDVEWRDSVSLRACVVMAMRSDKKCSCVKVRYKEISNQLNASQAGARSDVQVEVRPKPLMRPLEIPAEIGKHHQQAKCAAYCGALLVSRGRRPMKLRLTSNFVNTYQTAR
jgi:hypothetical protein